MTPSPARPEPQRYSVQLSRAPDAPVESGEVVVSDTALSFRAVAQPMPWAGRKVHKKVRAWIESVTWDPGTGQAVLDFGSEVWTVTGDDAADLACALDAQQAADAPAKVEGMVRLTIADDAPLQGTIRLDAERLRFRPEGAGVDRLNAAWSSITDVRLTGIRPSLHASIAGRAVRIEGDVAPRLAAWLTALAQKARVGAESTSDPQLVHWPAHRWHGALAIQGDLTVGTRHLQFVPSGLVERTLGLRDVVVPFDRVQRLVVHGWSTKKVTVVTDAGRETFTVDDIDARFEALVQSFHQGQQEWASDPERTRTVVEAVLARWRPVLEKDPSHVMEAHLAVQLRGRLDAAVGVLLQTADEVRFLPSGGPAGTAPVRAHPVPRILRNYSGAGARADEVSFSVSGEPYRYLPAEGAAFVRRFWDRCRSPSRIFHLDAPSRRAMMRVLGPSRFIRMRGLDGQLVHLQSLEEDGRTWVAVLGHGAQSPSIGERISVDVGQPEGVYRFEAAVVDHDPATQRAFLARPHTVRVYNQRRSYRVTVDLPARVRLDADPSPLLIEDSLMGPNPGRAANHALTLSDLSLGGCAARGAADLPLGASVELEVDLDGRRPLRVTGRVLRADPIDGSQLRRFGIRFENVHRSEEARLQRHVLRAQREELADLDAMVG